MYRTVCALTLGLLASALAFAPAGEDSGRLKEALALEEAMQDAIKTAEPSIACILVSRSDDYGRQFNQGPSTADPGQLGEFYADRVPGSEPTDPRRKLAERLDLSNPSTIPESFGSGVVLDERERLILTAYHVVRDASKIYVRLPSDKGSYANILAADPRSDLAVLQLIDKNLRLKAIKMGDGREVRKGQFVLSLANPFAAGFRDGSPSASWGIVSNVHRRAPVPSTEIERALLTLPQFATLLQTDVRLNLGCSGGALINLKGEMIGLTTALAAVSGSETPGGFALPMDPSIKAIIEVLKRGEEVEYGFLGVRFGANNRRGDACQVAEPVDNSPAERAGLRRDDYILSINGVPVHDGDDLYLQIGMALAGSTVRLEVAREPQGAPQVRTATLVKSYVPGKIIASKRPDPKESAGLRVDYSSILIQRGVRFGTSRIPDGVMIREVMPDSPADRARLQVDKIITHVNGKPVNTPAEFYREMRGLTGSVELSVASLEDRREKVKLDLP